MISQTKYIEKEILEPVYLCKGNGELNQESIGWARKPLFHCNLSGRWLRKKKWNYWCITNDECLFSATISNIDYAGMVFVYYLDFKTKKFIEKTVMTPFGKGCVMPDAVNETVLFKGSGMDIRMLHEDQGIHMIASCGNFDGFIMEADIKISYPDKHETLNVVIPWDKTTFQFTSKHECLPVSGTLRVGDAQYQFQPDRAFGCLDYGRGIWPRKISWNWFNASGNINGRKIGLNLGGQWTDGTGMNENAVIVDGCLTKISEDVRFEFDAQDYMKPWTIKSCVTDSVDLTFTPFFERIAKTNLKIIQSDLHQMIGHCTGHIKTEQGEFIGVDHLLGCTEDHFAKW